MGGVRHKDRYGQCEHNKTFDFCGICSPQLERVETPGLKGLTSSQVGSSAQPPYRPTVQSSPNTTRHEAFTPNPQPGPGPRQMARQAEIGTNTNQWNTEDPELAALRECVDALQALPEPGRSRAMRYLFARFMKTPRE